MSKDTQTQEWEEVQSGGWAKFMAAGDKAQWVFTGYHLKEANGQFAEQIVAELDTPEGTVYVGLPYKNPRYGNGIKNLKVGHMTLITLEGFYNQDKGELQDTPGKTKLGMSFAKNYSIKQKPLPEPTWNQPVSVIQDDASMFD